MAAPCTPEIRRSRRHGWPRHRSSLLRGTHIPCTTRARKSRRRCWPWGRSCMHIRRCNPKSPRRCNRRANSFLRNRSEQGGSRRTLQLWPPGRSCTHLPACIRHRWQTRRCRSRHWRWHRSCKLQAQCIPHANTNRRSSRWDRGCLRSDPCTRRTRCNPGSLCGRWRKLRSRRRGGSCSLHMR